MAESRSSFWQATPGGMGRATTWLLPARATNYLVVQAADVGAMGQRDPVPGIFVVPWIDSWLTSPSVSAVWSMYEALTRSCLHTPTVLDYQFRHPFITERLRTAFIRSELVAFEQRVKKPQGDQLSLDEIVQLVKENNLSGLPDELIICQIWKESSFKPSARTTKPNSTAAGLMGVTVLALQDLIGRKKDESKEDWRARARQVHESMTPAENIQYGTQYLKKRLGWVDGDLSEGLNGYGTGPGYSTSILACAACMKKGRGPSRLCLEKIRK